MLRCSRTLYQACCTASESISYLRPHSSQVTASANFLLFSPVPVCVCAQVGRTLNYQVRTSYNVVLRVRDSQGGQAQTIVTVNVLEVNKPPYFAGACSRCVA